MIYALAPARGTFGIGDYLKTDGVALADRVTVFSYEEVFEQATFPAGAYVFTSLDQLTPLERDLVLRVRAALREASPTTPLLNDPLRWLRRGALLKAAHTAGWNGFRANYAAGERDAGLRYPVFVRSESRHTGSLSPLIHNAKALSGALRRARRRGYHLDDLLVVEYCHTADAHGVFSKYSAMVLGDEIVPRSLTRSREWVTKLTGRITDQDAADAELAYLKSNPHEDWLRRVCLLGGVEYGRVDYGVMDGRPQLWEINTNPTIGADLSQPWLPGWPEDAMRRMAPGRELFNELFRVAAQRLDQRSTGATVRFEITGQQRETLRRERARRARSHRERSTVVLLRRAARTVANRLGWQGRDS